MSRLAIAFCAAQLVASSALAQDKSQYTLFNPTPTDKMRAFSTDRPTKAYVPYTVDAGRVQFEGDLLFYTFDGSSTVDSNITSLVVGNPTFKVGLLNNLDFEVGFSAYNNVRTEIRSAATSSTASGFGDVVARAKLNLFGNDGGTYALALFPYVKWPTAAAGIGNRSVEGGLLVPLAIALPGGFNAIVMGELDYQRNPNDPLYHANFPALLNVSKEIFTGVTAYAEIYANWTTHRDLRDIYTVDFALAWSPVPNFQLDIGVNIGLNAAAPSHQIYAGISKRF